MPTTASKLHFKCDLCDRTFKTIKGLTRHHLLCSLTNSTKFEPKTLKELTATISLMQTEIEKLKQELAAVRSTCSRRKQTTDIVQWLNERNEQATPFYDWLNTLDIRDEHMINLMHGHTILSVFHEIMCENNPPMCGYYDNPNKLYTIIDGKWTEMNIIDYNKLNKFIQNKLLDMLQMWREAVNADDDNGRMKLYDKAIMAIIKIPFSTKDGKNALMCEFQRDLYKMLVMEC